MLHTVSRPYIACSRSFEWVFFVFSSCLAFHQGSQRRLAILPRDSIHTPHILQEPTPCCCFYPACSQPIPTRSRYCVPHPRDTQDCATTAQSTPTAPVRPGKANHETLGICPSVFVALNEPRGLQPRAGGASCVVAFPAAASTSETSSLTTTTTTTPVFLFLVFTIFLCCGVHIVIAARGGGGDQRPPDEQVPLRPAALGATTRSRQPGREAPGGGVGPRQQHGGNLVVHACTQQHLLSAGGTYLYPGGTY